MEIVCLKEFYLDFPYLLASSGPFSMGAFYCCHLLSGVDLLLLPCPRAAMLGTALPAAPSCSAGGQERAVRPAGPQPEGCCCF